MNSAVSSTNEIKTLCIDLAKKIMLEKAKKVVWNGFKDSVVRNQGVMCTLTCSSGRKVTVL